LSGSCSYNYRNVICVCDGLCIGQQFRVEVHVQHRVPKGGPQDRTLRAALRADLGDLYRPVSVGDRPVCQVALQRRQQVPRDPLLLQALNDRWPPNVVKRSTDIDEYSRRIFVRRFLDGLFIFEKGTYSGATRDEAILPPGVKVLRRREESPPDEPFEYFPILREQRYWSIILPVTRVSSRVLY
jgi:hypothetical protein